MVSFDHTPPASPDMQRVLKLFATRQSALEAENARLRSLLAAAERLIMAHHSTATHRAPPGAICQVCAGEHEAVQAIWKELHQPASVQEDARP